MRITDIEGFVVQMPRSEEDDALRERYPYPPKHFSLGIVRVFTDEGITGYGYGYLNPAYLERTMRALVGVDPFAVERLLEERQLPSVIEHALWDVIGKAAGKPVFKLLGGYKEKVRAYVTCVWPGNPNQSDVTPQAQAEDALRYSENGFKGIKIRVPGIKSFEETFKALGFITIVMPLSSSYMTGYR